LYNFIDLHCHALCGIDDGARNQEAMFKMLDIAYLDGIRTICFTPHFKIYWFKSDEEIAKYSEKINKSFEIACDYVKNKYSDMELLLGNEIMYFNDIFDCLSLKKCNSLAGSSYVLVEFSPHAAYYDIKMAISKFLRKGYRPIIAHVERYSVLTKDFSLLKELKELGAFIQINSTSITKFKFGKQARFIKRALRQKLVDVVATDSHNENSSIPSLSKAHLKVMKKHGKEYAKKIFYDNQKDILYNTHKEF